MEDVPNQICQSCGIAYLTVYYSDETDDKLGIWCENCNLKAYFCGETSIPFS